jgi:tRNA A-37 threonylcarbamoyl transferase component Bud32
VVEWSSSEGFAGTERFAVRRCIGSGGMGAVYEAVDRDHDTRVALKVLTALSADALLRFKAEFRALRDLEHPNVVSFGELYEHQGRWFFTMEFIEGVDFLAWVRPNDEPIDREEPTVPLPVRPIRSLIDAGPEVIPARVLVDPDFDEARLRQALGQLVRGTAALHATGKIHRDIKPSNVRVTADGRVVLLDFGLVADLEHPVHITDVEKIVGTPAFMAPEQAGLREVGVAADWYAVGVMLYLSLTGRLPFTGGAMSILLDKQRYEPAPPRALVRDLPPDLDALCVALLNRDPELRPSEREILRRLHLEDDDGAAELTSSSLSHAAPFIGRAVELGLLRQAFDAARAGQATTVYVHGESGVGKSALMHAFGSAMTAEKSAVVLSGRCYESELVPFKAVDGLIDALSRYLMSLPRSVAAALLPGKALLLTQLFPVLRRVEVIAESPLPLEAVRDPQELRGRAFAAVRELMARLGERYPLILTLDDMQWSDADSVALLRELMRVPDPPPLLLLLAMRTDPGHHEAPIHDVMMPGQVRHLHLSRLSPLEARELASRLLQQVATVDEALAQNIADEAAGHPLFIDELARHAHAAHGRAGRLEDALWDRVAKLDGEARAILEIVAVAGAPLAKDTVARAVGIDFSEFQKRVSLLRISHLLRWSDLGLADSLEPYHDRVRDAVLAHLAPAERRACHRRVALAIEARGLVDLDALARHWRGAGEDGKAIDYALQAAAQATTSLAFERAAQFYRLALDLGITDARLAQRVRIHWADALKNAGRGPAAAQAYLAAAAANASATAAERLELQRRAAEQLLLSGHFDDGLAALGAVLRAIGMDLPATPRRALVSLLFHRARLRMRGLAFRERDESQVAPEELTRSDVSWAASAGLSIIDNVRGADFQCRNLLQALRIGEPHRVARALAIEGGHSSIGAHKSEKRTQRLLGAAEQLALRLEDPYALGLNKIVSAMAALLSGKWRRSCQLCDEGEAILRARCTGVTWELDSAQMFGMDALWFLGELRELLRRQPLRVAEAQERGDLYAVINFRTGAPNLVWLAQDSVDEARRQLRDAMAHWSHRGVHIQHYRELFSHMHIDLYSGDGATAYARALERWSALADAQLFRVRMIRLIMTDLRARAALATAMARPDPEALLRRARRDARTLARGGMPWCAPAAAIVQAALAIRHRPDATVAQLRAAVHGFDAADMALHAAIARHRLGRLVGGDEGRALLETAAARLRDLGVKNVAAMAAMLAPGFAD